MFTAPIPPPTPAPSPTPVPCDTANYIKASGAEVCAINLKKQLAWADAKAECEKIGATLPIISNAPENADILKVKTQMNLGEAWLGLNDIATEGSYIWTDGTPAKNYVNWAGGEPNNGGVPNNMNDQDCIRMYSNGQWDDLGCSALQNVFCERGTKQPINQGNV